MTIPIKNKDGIAKMREACAIAASVLDSLKPLVRPGITTQDLEEAGRDFIASHGARSACFGYQHGTRRYPAHTCISVNDEVVHGIPSERILQAGDILSVDSGAIFDGWNGDSAITLVIPDPMGATGGSLLQVLEHYATSGAGRAAKVVFAHLIVTPEYVRRVHATQPDVRIHAIRLDRGNSSERALASLPGQHPAEESGLDPHQYVVPGAGGLGEVLNNAWVCRCRPFVPCLRKPRSRPVSPSSASRSVVTTGMPPSPSSAC